MLKVCSPTKNKEQRTENQADDGISDDKMILFHALKPFKHMIKEINSEFTF